MKTDHLIRALTADHDIRVAPVGRYFLATTAGGLALAALLFFTLLGPRPDVLIVAADPRFLFKFVVTLTLAATAALLALRLMRPGAETSTLTLALAAAPALILLGVVVELATVPSSAWAMRQIGKNMVYCLTYVPLLSAPLLVAALIAFRRAAPTRPALAGAVSGLLAGGIGATLYAANCTDDSPLFVATWYTIAIAIVTLVGSIAGARLLRW